MSKIGQIFNNGANLNVANHVFNSSVKDRS